jgi:cyclopropane-fatty-acyl-phospholipid synthase
MNSRIYNGTVMHLRLQPVRHSFQFPFYFYAIDLDELPELCRRVKGFGRNRWSPVCLRDADYLRGSGPLREQLSEFIDTSGLDRIVLITVARFMKKVFNPVSFYYGLRRDGSPVCVVAEVNNTFGERHLYVMQADGSFPVQCNHLKQFHVSPFNDMNGQYAFSLSEPGEELNIEIKLIRNGAVTLIADMRGTGTELTTKSLWKTILRHPFTAALTLPRIFWQAALLHYKRKLPVFKKPPPNHKMTLRERT